MHPMLTMARRAAEEGGKVIRAGFRQLDKIQIEEKGRGDLVSVIDRHSEEVIRGFLAEKYPRHDFLGEEYGHLQAGKSESDYLWVIDPLDGTANFLHGLPQFAISIALIYKGKTEVGLVYNPISEEIFTACRGQGAQLNGRKLRVHASRDSARATIATGFPYRTPSRMPQQLANLQHVLEPFGDIRRLGAAALDLCFVACNRVDGYFEMGVHPWDIAAGMLIAQEAGALVSDFAGGATMFDSGEVIAANPYLHKILLEQIIAAKI